MRMPASFFRRFRTTRFCLVALSLLILPAFCGEDDDKSARTGFGQGTQGDKSYESGSSTTTKGPQTETTTTTKTIETPEGGDTRKVTHGKETTFTSKGSAGEVKVTSGQSQTIETTGSGGKTVTDTSSSSVTSGGGTTTKETSTSTTTGSDGNFQSGTVKGSVSYEKPIGDAPDKEAPPSSSVNVGVKLGETDLIEEQKGAYDTSHAAGSTVTKDGTVLTGSASFESGQYQAGGKASATADKDGVKASVSLSGEANVAKGQVQGQVEKEVIEGATVKGEVKGTVTVGVKGGVDADVQVGPDKVAASAGGKAFAGVEAGGEASATLDLNDSLGISLGGTAKGSVSAGAGVEGKASAELSWTKVKFSLGAGATAGLGMKGELGVEVDIAGLVEGRNPAKVAMQDKVDGAILDIVKQVKNGELQIPPWVKFSDILKDMKDKAALFAKNPEKDAQGKDKDIATVIANQFGFQKPPPKPTPAVAAATPQPPPASAPPATNAVASPLPTFIPTPPSKKTNEMEVALSTNALIPSLLNETNTFVPPLLPPPPVFTNLFDSDDAPTATNQPPNIKKPDLATSEPVAPTGTAATASGPGKKPTVDDFVDLLIDLALSDNSSSYNNMQNNTQVSQASTSGDSQSQGADNALNNAGAEGQTIQNQSASDTANANSTAGWGATIGNALLNGIQQGGTAMGGVIGTSLAANATGAIFGNTNANTTATGGGAGSTAGGSSGTDTVSSPGTGKDNAVGGGSSQGGSSSGGAPTQGGGGTQGAQGTQSGGGTAGGGSQTAPTPQTQTSGSFTAKLVPSGNSYYITVTGISNHKLAATVSGTDGYSASFNGVGTLTSPTIPAGASGVNDTVSAKDLDTGETATFNFKF